MVTVMMLIQTETLVLNLPDDGIDQDCDGEDATEEPDEPASEPSGETIDPDTGEGNVDEDDLTKDGEGCSTVSSSELTIFGMLFALIGVRRRK